MDHDQGESVSFFTGGDRFGLPDAGRGNALKLPGAEFFGLPLGHCGCSLSDADLGGQGGDFGLGWPLGCGHVEYSRNLRLAPGQYPGLLCVCGLVIDGDLV